jgi:hypothetical protein
MKTNKILAAAVITAGLLSAMPAMASSVLVTTTQTQLFDFSSLDGNTTLSFNGFDSSLGTLTSFHFAWTVDKTLNNNVINIGSSASIGSPTAVSATSTTLFSGSTTAGPLFSDTNTLTTAGFTGTVPSGVTLVGTASATGLSGNVDLFTPASNLSGYIGGLNFLNLAISNTGSQGGSVPGSVFTGNNGTATGTVSLYYDYQLSSVPEPVTLGMMGLGLAGLTAFRRRKSS